MFSSVKSKDLSHFHISPITSLGDLACFYCTDSFHAHYPSHSHSSSVFQVDEHKETFKSYESLNLSHPFSTPLRFGMNKEKEGDKEGWTNKKFFSFLYRLSYSSFVHKDRNFKKHFGRGCKTYVSLNKSKLLFKGRKILHLKSENRGDRLTHSKKEYVCISWTYMLSNFISTIF